MSININDLTIGEAIQLASMFGNNQETKIGLNAMIGKKCIVRTYFAGVWFGEIEQKSGNEVIVKNARRMWQWWAAASISLSGVALHGIKQDKSKICPAVSSVWLEAIEIIPCTNIAIELIESAKDVKAE